jgi:hypothetical protein
MQSVLISVAAVGITAGRALSLVAVAIGLISVIMAAFARARRARGIAAVVLGLVGILFSSVRLANTTAIGTGSGRLGAFVALAVALLGVVLGGRALARSRPANRHGQ